MCFSTSSRLRNLSFCSSLPFLTFSEKFSNKNLHQKRCKTHLSWTWPGCSLVFRALSASCYPFCGIPSVECPCSEIERKRVIAEQVLLIRTHARGDGEDCTGSYGIVSLCYLQSENQLSPGFHTSITLFALMLYCSSSIREHGTI